MKAVKCPCCKKKVEWSKNPFRPFCSEACKNHDLGKWANEEYRVPVEEMDGSVDMENELDRDKKNKTKS